MIPILRKSLTICLNELNEKDNYQIQEVLYKFNIPNTKLDTSKTAKQFYSINIK